MNLFKNKLVLLSPFIILAIVIILGLTISPTLNPTPKNIPIAFVNEDQGVEVANQGNLNIGKVMQKKIQKITISGSKNDPIIKWISVKNSAKVKRGLDNKEYYGAFVISKDFSEKEATLLTVNPKSPEIQILVNQGMNSMAATVVGQMLNGIVENLNNNVRTQLLAEFEKKGLPLTTTQASAMASPIQKKVINVNEVGTHSANGNAPVALFQPLWIGSIAGAVILFLMMSKLVFATRMEKFMNLQIQIFVGAVLALFAGFGLTWIMEALGMNIPEFTDTALFLSIVYFCFFLMITAVLSWLGIKGIGIFVLILFLGAPVLAMPPEFMSTFYREWIYSWLPIRFMVEGLRELFFFGKGLSWNHPTSILVWIGIFGLFGTLVSSFKFHSKAKIKTNQCNM